VALNCGALPEHLAEAELFGYRRGAFTGAERASLGHFRAAHGGTLFLDEMPELSLPLQAKLLRVVEEQRVTGLGETSSVAVDVRIVSASQVVCAELVTAGRLREDLAARLTGIEQRLPSLSARRSDIGLLFAHFLNLHSGGRSPEVEPKLVEALCLHDWPQNVRELETLTRRLLALHGHESRLALQHLGSELSRLVESRAARTESGKPVARADYDLARIQRALGENGGNVKAAADALGISRQRVYRLLGKLEVGSDVDSN
jgi:transcriptional regulator with PAS, ATPase and Fis domain